MYTHISSSAISLGLTPNPSGKARSKSASPRQGPGTRSAQLHHQEPVQAQHVEVDPLLCPFVAPIVLADEAVGQLLGVYRTPWALFTRL